MAVPCLKLGGGVVDTSTFEVGPPLEREPPKRAPVAITTARVVISVPSATTMRSRSVLVSRATTSHGVDKLAPNFSACKAARLVRSDPLMPEGKPR